MSAYLSRLISSKADRSFRHVAKQMAERFPDPFKKAAHRAEEYARGLLTGGTLFEELGFYYIGPVDGHNLSHLLLVLRHVRASSETRPVLVHVVTQKGKAYATAEASADKFPGVGKLDGVTGVRSE